MTQSIVRVDIVQSGPRAEALIDQLARRLYRDELRIVDNGVMLHFTLPYEEAFNAVKTALDDGTEDWQMHARPVWAQT